PVSSAGHPVIFAHAKSAGSGERDLRAVICECGRHSSRRQRASCEVNADDVPSDPLVICEYCYWNPERSQHSYGASPFQNLPATKSHILHCFVLLISTAIDDPLVSRACVTERVRAANAEERHEAAEVGAR